MKKERFFPYWTDLERVIAVAQSQTVNNIRLTLVSVETYAMYGFLLTINFESIAPNPQFDRAGRGWMRARIVDYKGNQYKSFLTMIPGISYQQVYRGRAVMICMPHLADQADRLSITIDTIEWEFTDSDETLPSSEVIPGPWVFDVAL